MIITIIGTRPQFIKAAVISNAFAKRGIREVVIDTKQHYSKSVHKNILTSLPFALPLLKQVKGLIEKPTTVQDLVFNIEQQGKKYFSKATAFLVYGDTNSTLAGALVAKKHQIKLIHIEAGERSRNLSMPEENNRAIVDYLSDLCLCVNKKGQQNLANYTAKKVVVGDVMLDSLLATTLINLKTEKEYIYFTLHRQESTNSVEKINATLALLGKLSYPIIWPMHPRLQQFKKQLMIPSNVNTILPVNYSKSLSLIENSVAVVTDSGGLQKEAYWLQKKCITLRKETEWTETLTGNWNILVKDLSLEKLQKALKKKPNLKYWSLNQFGGGKAATNVVNAIQQFLWS